MVRMLLQLSTISIIVLFWQSFISQGSQSFTPRDLCAGSEVLSIVAVGTSVYVCVRACARLQDPDMPCRLGRHGLGGADQT